MTSEKKRINIGIIVTLTVVFISLASIAFVVINNIIDNKTKEQKEKDLIEFNYQQGIHYMASDNYEEAFMCLCSVPKDYKDSDTQRDTCMNELYEQGKQFAFDGDLTSAERKFLLLPNDYKDVAERKQVIADHRKFKGTWKCETNNLDLKTTVYVDYDNTPKVRAEISDHDALLLDEPIILIGEDLEIHGDRFSWAIYGTDRYSFVYSEDAYTVIKQPVVEGSRIYRFARIQATDYDELNSQYTTTEF